MSDSGSSCTSCLLQAGSLHREAGGQRRILLCRDAGSCNQCVLEIKLLRFRGDGEAVCSLDAQQASDSSRLSGSWVRREAIIRSLCNSRTLCNMAVQCDVNYACLFHFT